MADYILEMKEIIKEFSGVRALNNVNLRIKRGEIHALCGENGAGKSTLMNVLSGLYPYGSYSGEIMYDGEVCQFKNLRDSEAKGIVIIHQELALSPYLSIKEKHFFRERTNKTWRDRLELDGTKNRKSTKNSGLENRSEYLSFTNRCRASTVGGNCEGFF